MACRKTESLYCCLETLAGISKGSVAFFLYVAERESTINKYCNVVFMNRFGDTKYFPPSKMRVGYHVFIMKTIWFCNRFCILNDFTITFLIPGVIMYYWCMFGHWWQAIVSFCLLYCRIARRWWTANGPGKRQRPQGAVMWPVKAANAYSDIGQQPINSPP